MPAPSSSIVIQLAGQAFRDAGLAGADAHKLATGLGKAVAASLGQLVGDIRVLPGQPAAVDPMSGSGATAGPGLLQGALSASAAEGHASAELGALKGTGIEPLIKVYGAVMSQAATLFVAGVQAAPGAAIAGFKTVAPAPLMGATPAAAALEPICLGEMDGQEIKGTGSRWLARALASTISDAMAAALAMVLVAPGTSCAPGATASPGSLM